MTYSSRRWALTSKVFGAVGLFSLATCKSTGHDRSLVKDVTSTSVVKIDPEFFPITGPTDAIYRNRKITQNYYYGAESLNKVLGKNHEDSSFQANWLHFGIWGSMRAGESIDGTDIQVASTVKDFVFDYLDQSLAWLPSSIRSQSIENFRKDRELIKTLGKVIQQALAGGNQRVADEIMGLTDRYIRMLGCESSFNEENLQKFLSTFEYRHEKDAAMSEVWGRLLEEIPSLSKGRLHLFGQDALARAFAAYHKSRFEVDPMTRSQMIHYGNLLIAIHEQFVLQTYITGAIGILNPASSIYRKAVTVFTMDIGMPDDGFTGVSRIGQGLKRYPLRNNLPESNFAAELQNYSWPPLVDLSKVTGLDKASGRGATDWQDYKSRVYLIAGLIRTKQADPLMASFPFAGPHQTAHLFCQ